MYRPRPRRRPPKPALHKLIRTLSLAQLRGANQIGVPRTQFGGHPRRGDRCYSKLTASIVLTTDHPRVPRERHLCPRLWVGLALRRAPSRQSTCSNADRREPPLNPPGFNGGMQRGYTVPCSAVPRVAPAVVETGPGREGDPLPARATPTHSHTLARPAQTVVPLVLVLLRLALSPSVAGPWIMQSATGTPAAVIVAIIEHTVPVTDHPRVPCERHPCPRLSS